MHKRRVGSWQTCLALVLVLATASSPILAQEVPVLVQETNKTACLQAQLDAKTDISGGSWFAVGFFTNVIGLIIANGSEPAPAASALLGKPPEYVAAYTDCYGQEGKKIRAKNAQNGCLVGVAAGAVLAVILLSSGGK